MTIHLGSIHQHYSDRPPIRRIQLRLCKATPRHPPQIHWLINL